LPTPKQDRVFVFGGHHNAQCRLNDTWFLSTKEFEWQKVGDEQDNKSNQESKIGAPSPRANSNACIYKNKVYMFGGHGGLNYARTAFNDLFTFDFETETWEQIKPSNSAPEGRGGHSVFASDNKVYIYGGWNSEQQYNNVLLFDLEKLEWSDPDIYNEIHRWNHSSILVEAIPTWKFFIFGGECAEYNEGTPRAFGEYVNSSCYLDLGTMKWTTYASDAEIYSNIPQAREYTAIAYDQRDSKLIMFGGWNNGWFNDLYSLNVGKIVGPSYAITASDPATGQLSGNVPLTIKGQGFKDANIKVLFTCGNRPVDNTSKMTLEVPGYFVSESELTCVTPNFEQFGPKECVMQLSIGNGDLTTTAVAFNYFLNTRAMKSLAYGPGLLQDVAPNTPVEFIIQARNDLGENRSSGRDKFEVRVRKIIPAAAVVEEE
jgi:dynein heavy chain